jgi:HJR/Mrr/RecB family endonuclease
MSKMYKRVNDLGVAAYLTMHGYKVVGRQAKAIMFSIDKEESEEFEQKSLEYLASEFHRFDHYLMSLKKIGEYMPESA